MADETPLTEETAAEEAELLKAEIAALKAQLGKKPAAKSDPSRHPYTFDVLVTAGPGATKEPHRITACSDESEAIQKLVAKTGIVSSEHRFRVTKVEAA